MSNNERRAFQPKEQHTQRHRVRQPDGTYENGQCRVLVRVQGMCRVSGGDDKRWRPCRRFGLCVLGTVGAVLGDWRMAVTRPVKITNDTSEC